MTSLVLCVMTSCLLLIDVEGSVIAFNSTSSFVKPLVSTNLTLTCKILDTSTPSIIIGKRSVPQIHDVINDEEIEREDNTSDDVTGSDDDLGDLEDQPVTQTADDVPYVTSMVISRNGQDIATLSEHFPVTQLVPDAIVTGQLTTGQGERGCLQITWPHPSQAEVGSYKCEVLSLSAQGHHVIFSETLNITESQISMNDLILKVHQLELEKEELTQSLTSLQNVARVEPDIFFSASLTPVITLSVNQVLIFDHVFSNEGQAYNHLTGIFTTPLDGFYMFDIHVLSKHTDTFWLQLQHNDISLIKMNKYGNEQGGEISNSVIVKLQKNDFVKVVCTDTVTGVSGLYYTTFNGRLISLR